MKVVAFLLAYVALSQAAVFNTALKSAYSTRENIDIMITMRDKTSKVLEKIESQNFINTNAKATTLYNELNSFVSASQKEVLSILSKFKSTSKATGLWINNKISVRNASIELVNSLIDREDIEEIREAKVIHLEASIAEDSNEAKDLEWGVAKINGPKAWEAGYTGENVVVSNIDTGVRYTHAALRGGWREEYGWFDPYEGTLTPNDQNGHGSHTMGSIAGYNGTGVAPGAKWVACKGCATSSCTEEALDMCGQWTVCPTKPDGTEANCTMRPHVSSNSWGGGQEDPFYDEVIKSFNAVDIIPVFAIGNSGPGCRTANSPGDRPGVISVGATNNQDVVASFSSHGPTLSVQYIKPEISAPGVNIRSCGYNGDNLYAILSGTSMATPHIAGVVALLIQSGVKTRVDIERAFQHVNATARPVIESIICTGAGVDPVNPWPNNSFGWGRIDAAGVLGLPKKK